MWHTCRELEDESESVAGLLFESSALRWSKKNNCRKFTSPSECIWSYLFILWVIPFKSLNMVPLSCVFSSVCVLNYYFQCNDNGTYSCYCMFKVIMFCSFQDTCCIVVAVILLLEERAFMVLFYRHFPWYPFLTIKWKMHWAEYGRVPDQYVMP